MYDRLYENYPEAAPLIEQAVEEHGEEWVIQNYYRDTLQLEMIMDVPPIEELPFFDEERHESMDEETRVAMAEAMGEYLHNLRTGHKPGKE
ncbi:hypothetical protein [Halomarina rubra]|uniref:DUF8110 domain-containing protein n=1 Tax=Halomarina rubra TaxID=2071873 RepID=A0ABD6AV34_9EURY|nr:hypothetical protein [Halomarina rubra]